MKTLLHAAWIATMDRPAFRDGGVIFENRTIVDVGPAKALHANHPDAHVVDSGESIILPGLVNAHTHLELTQRSIIPIGSGTFVDWIQNLIKANREAPTDGPSFAVGAGIKQCIKFGVTCVGDISQQADLTRAVLTHGPIRTVSFGETLGLAARRSRFDELLPIAIDQGFNSPFLQTGISPHAPYTVDINGYRQCARAAKALGLPMATHLAETPFEPSFLQDHSGLFSSLWSALGINLDNVPTFAGGPVRMAKEAGLLDIPTLLAHVNYCDDEELALLAGGVASVVYCPRTHAYFGHPPHRWRDMLARGMNVAVGTDSCASSPDLNLVDDLRLLHRIAPEAPVQLLWEMATIRGARALQWVAQLGSIEPGKHADFTVFPAATENPLQSILETAILPSATYVNGLAVSRASRP